MLTLALSICPNDCPDLQVLVLASGCSIAVWEVGMLTVAVVGYHHYYCQSLLRLLFRRSDHSPTESRAAHIPKGSIEPILFHFNVFASAVILQDNDGIGLLRVAFADP
jgi:hypothetical protein